LTTSYTTSVALTQGRTYTFKVQARNSVGLSAFSTSLAILTATVPGKPTSVSTSISGSNVLVSWATPDDGSAAITSYTIKLQ
jgi:hypothetical protein